MAYDEAKFIADLFRIGRDLRRRGDSSDLDAFQVETAATEVERLQARVAWMERELAEARAALRADGGLLAEGHAP